VSENTQVASGIHRRTWDLYRLELGRDTPMRLLDSSLFNAAIINLVVNATQGDRK